MPTRRRIALGFLLVGLAAVVIAALNYRLIFSAAGAYLVESQPPQKADAALVLAGDHRGMRIMRAAELAASGYVPIVLVSGPMEMYGMNEATLAIQYATSHGASASYFEPVVIRAMSTSEEARAFAPELRRRNIRTLLLVTSNFHTRRAAAIFRRALAPDVRVISIAAGDPFFGPDTWWQNREGQKTLFYEYTKTLAGWMGL